jgi:hypothetical protein
MLIAGCVMNINMRIRRGYVRIRRGYMRISEDNLRIRRGYMRIRRGYTWIICAVAMPSDICEMA